ncbi:MAG: aldo/keto reductase [Veillonella sp.]|uniref:aldo/keto reductase n=1 Tax=Veillonella sp. TaxID=1926307 RepID=UPI0025FA8E34|nr:aldo/keto reductase [Veillonella sp.]MBE6080524.1 aldo/keto reductase [Veillonella sp.]
MTTKIPTVTLNDGVKIPVYGFGTFLIPADGSTYKAVREALDLGIRHIDTAVAYFNEAEVGKAVRESGIPREEIFVTSKLWLQDYGYEAAKKGIETSLRKLGLDYMDLYLIHQPYGDVPGAWRAMEEAKAEGKIRSLGVSNMTPKIWNQFVPQFKTMPSVNQVEFNPYYQQQEIRKIMAEHDVKLEAWGPLGQGREDLLTNPVIADIANSHGKNAGQVILRFEVQEGIIVFPKSTKPERIKSNMNIFDFELTEAEMNEMRALDTGKGVHNPDNEGVAEFLLANYDVHAND